MIPSEGSGWSLGTNLGTWKRSVGGLVGCSSPIDQLIVFSLHFLHVVLSQIGGCSKIPGFNFEDFGASQF